MCSYVPESLPNITSAAKSVGNTGGLNYSSGCFMYDIKGWGLGGGTGVYVWLGHIDASNCSSAYQANAKVRPDSYAILYCLKY